MSGGSGERRTNPYCTCYMYTITPLGVTRVPVAADGGVFARPRGVARCAGAGPGREGVGDGGDVDQVGGPGLPLY